MVVAIPPGNRRSGHVGGDENSHPNSDRAWVGQAGKMTGDSSPILYRRVADNPGGIWFCLNLEFHAKIAK